MSTVANNYDGLLQTFENITADTTMDDDTLDCAKGFVRELEDFEFVFMLYTYEQIFSETDVVFKYCPAEGDGCSLLQEKN